MNLKEELQRCLYHIIRTNPFTGALLQEMTFKFDNQTVPTAAISYNAKSAKFELLLNSDYFQSLKSSDERIAILMHEILHFLHNHIFRWQQMNIDMKDRMYWNIAADMAINQFIPNLPKGCINVKDFKTIDPTTKKKIPFPEFKTMEEYFDLVQKNREKDKTKGKKLMDDKGNPEKDSHGNEITDEKGEPYKNEDGSAQEGTGNEGANKDLLDKYKPFDEHDWDNLAEDEKERMIREMKNVLNRTIEKTSYTHSSIPGFVKDFLQEIETHLKKFNYKAILKEAIKRTAMAQDRESTWKRMNKRYGEMAPGTSTTRIPKLDMYVDTSGSISYRELNEFLDIIDGFLKQGTKTCTLNLWHTDLYHTQKYKLKTRFTGDLLKKVQGGGTDPTPALDKIAKERPELAIVLTDGFFDGYRNHKALKGVDIIWIISENGNMEHPNKAIGKTIPMKGIK